MFGEKFKSASVTKKNRGVQGTHAQSTKQGRVIVNKNIRKTEKNDLPIVKGKTRIREIIPHVASNEGETRAIP